MTYNFITGSIKYCGMGNVYRERKTIVYDLYIFIIYDQYRALTVELKMGNKSLQKKTRQIMVSIVIS